MVSENEISSPPADNVTSDSVDTREVIAHVATKMFAERGYQGASIRDLAEAAGVTKPVLYYYFKSKENLFITLINEAYDFFYAKMEEIFTDTNDFWERLYRITRLYFSLYSQFEDTVRLIYLTAFGPRGMMPKVDLVKLEERHFEYLGELFRDGIEKGFIRNEQIELLIQHYLGSISIHMQALLLKGMPLPDRLDEIVIDLVFRGIEGKPK